MKDGRFIQVGTPTDVIMHPVNDYVRDFVNDVPRSRVLKAASLVKPIPIVSFDDLQETPLNSTKFPTGTSLGLVNDAGVLLGVVKADAFSETQQSLGDIARLAAKSCDEDSSLDEVLKHIGSAGEHIAVVDREGSLKGIITKDDAVSALIAD